jgi:hypothetical protein
VAAEGGIDFDDLDRYVIEPDRARDHHADGNRNPRARQHPHVQAIDAVGEPGADARPLLLGKREVAARVTTVGAIAVAVTATIRTVAVALTIRPVAIAVTATVCLIAVTITVAVGAVAISIPTPVGLVTVAVTVSIAGCAAAILIGAIAPFVTGFIALVAVARIPPLLAGAFAGLFR